MSLIISEEELQRRLKSENNLANQLSVVKEKDVPKREYTPQIKNESVRVLAGALAHLDSPANVSREFGLTPQQVKSAANSQKDSVKKRVDATRDRVSELALNQLLGALGVLTPDTLVGEKPKDIAAIAASLSKVVQNMTPRDSGESRSPVQVLIYAPEQKSESHYKTIDV